MVVVEEDGAQLCFYALEDRFCLMECVDFKDRCRKLAHSDKKLRPPVGFGNTYYMASKPAGGKKAAFCSPYILAA